MIHLFIVMLLTADVPIDDTSYGGRYATSYRSFESIAACESYRSATIEKAKEQEKSVLISRCAADRDYITFSMFRK